MSSFKIPFINGTYLYILLGCGTKWLYFLECSKYTAIMILSSVCNWYYDFSNTI